MTATIGPRAAAFRKAVRLLSASLRPSALKAYETNFSCRDRLLNSVEPDRERVAWALVGMWAVAVVRGGRPTSFLEVEREFYGGTRDLAFIADHTAPEGQTLAVTALESIEGTELKDLIPYVLDQSDLGTRRQVLRDPTQNETRQLRKASGTFYTPADVAEFIVRDIATIGEGRFLDPACGTGVFLVATLRHLISLGVHPLDAISRIYGIDLDAIALDAAGFVMTASLSSTVLRDLDPIRIWHLARLNLARWDSLGLLAENAAASDQSRGTDVAMREQLRHQVLNCQALPKVATRQPKRTLGGIFPEAGGGFEGVMANPPYAPLGPRLDLHLLAHRFESLRPGAVTSRTNTFIPFVEYMWKASAPGGAAGMIIPMSIAYSSEHSVRQLRIAISRVSAQWKFRFYDRTPDAVFGDDVKQRVCIVTMRKEPDSGASTSTSGLFRWTSHQRPLLFVQQPTLVDISTLPIADGIPKLSHDWELDLFKALTVSEVVDANTQWRLGTQPGQVGDRLWIGATAYNWLPVYRRVETSTPTVQIRIVATPTDDAADWAYAVLRSRVTYWLWRVIGDGFHVPQSFVSHLPFVWSATNAYDARLAEVGRELWAYARQRPIQSVNAGRVTVSFLESRSELLDEVDSLLLARYPVAKTTALHLRSFVTENLLVGRIRNRGAGVLVTQL